VGYRYFFVFLFLAEAGSCSYKTAVEWETDRMSRIGSDLSVSFSLSRMLFYCAAKEGRRCDLMVILTTVSLLNFRRPSFPLRPCCLQQVPGSVGFGGYTPKKWLFGKQTR